LARRGYPHAGTPKSRTTYVRPYLHANPAARSWPIVDGPEVIRSQALANPDRGVGLSRPANAQARGRLYTSALFDTADPEAASRVVTQSVGADGAWPLRAFGSAALAGVDRDVEVAVFSAKGRRPCVPVLECRNLPDAGLPDDMTRAGARPNPPDETDTQSAGQSSDTASLPARVARAARRGLRAVASETRRGTRRLRGSLAGGDRTKRVTFMVPFAYGMGGIPRTVFTVANALAEREYDVSLVTLVRTSEHPYFELDPRVTVVALEDRFDPAHPEERRPRPRHDKQADPRVRQLDRKPSELIEGAHSSFTAYVDELMREHLESLPPGVIVSTRPEFTVAAIRWSHPDSLIVHQEHLSFVGRKKPLRDGSRDLALRRGLERPADAFLTLTDADLERWQTFVGESDTRWGVIPNATPFDVDEPAPLDSRTILAAGRFTHQKGFDRLVAAYAPLAESHPDWQLHLYGHGELWDRISGQVEELGVADRVQLKGITSEFEAVLRNAAVYAMSSRFEGLPMVLLEAFSKGVPPVSFDCPEGPRQLIQDGVNGLLVPEGDVPALTEALRRVMDDDELRHRLGGGALTTAADYHVDAVVDRWIALFEELDAKRAGRG